MNEALMAQAVRALAQTPQSESDAKEVAQKLVQTVSTPPNMDSDSDYFRDLIGRYGSSGLAEKIHAPGKVEKKGTLIASIVDPIDEMSREIKKSLETLSQAHDPQQLLAANFVLNKTTSILTLLATLGSKTVQHMETLLRMQ